MAPTHHRICAVSLLLITASSVSCGGNDGRETAEVWDADTQDLGTAELPPLDTLTDLDDGGGQPGDDTAGAVDTVAGAADTIEAEDTPGEETREEPLDTVPACEDVGPCIVAEIGPGGACAYVTLPDGEPCPPSDDPCVVSAHCVAGECVDAWTPCQDLRPLLLVHGVNGSSANFEVMIQRLTDDGWPAEWIYAFDAEDPSWGCNVDNAAAIQALAEQAMIETCQPRIDLVAHSMGTLSSRYFVKNLGGAQEVNTYVTLGGMHHGLLSSCFAPDFLGVCVWQEICQWGDFVNQLNADPATPGPCNWVSIYSTADETIPADSSQLDGAENIEFQGIAHDGPDGLLEDPAVYAEVKRVLQYPCW